MRDGYYLIDKQLTVKPLTAYLGIKDAGKQETVQGETGEPPLPVSPDGMLNPGVLYASSTDPNVRFYLPGYALNVVEGRYTTSLKWRGPNDDPNGPLAFLTIEVIGSAPQAPAGTVLQEIPHQAVARIGYRMPVQGMASASGSEAFDGSWLNVDPNTRGMTRLDIVKANDQAFTFHGWGKCHPQDCDWGLTNAAMQGEQLVGSFNAGFVTTTVSVHRQGNHLIAQVDDVFAPGDPRPPMHNQYELAPAGGDPADTRPLLWIEFGALEAVGGQVRRGRLEITSKPDFDRLYSIMTDAQYDGRLELHLLATAGRRTWRQIILGDADVLVQKSILNKKILFTDMLDPTTLTAPTTNPDAPTKTVNVDDKTSRRLNWDQAIKLAQTPAGILLKNLEDSTNGPDRTGLLDILRNKFGDIFKLHHFERDPGAARTPVTRGGAPGVSTRTSETVRTPLRTPGVTGTGSPIMIRGNPVELDRIVDRKVLGPTLYRAFAPALKESLPTSDVMMKSQQGMQRAVPVRTVMTDTGQPALLKIAVETVETITPFCFPLATNAYVFDIPGDVTTETHHVLIRMEVRDGSGQVIGVFYQDSAYDDLFYYQPQEFRLPRVDVAPYLPDLRVVFFELVTQDGTGGDTQAQLNYKVRIAYRTVPYIDPLLLDLAQQQVPQVRARFNVLAPESSTYTLMVPQDESGGALTATPRPDAELHFDVGIVDEVELTRTEFERVFAFFQSPSGTGLDGTVRAALLGNLNTDVSVHLSLKQNAGAILVHTYKGPQANGMHLVTVRNPLESAVRIEKLYRVGLGNGAVAFPQASPGVVIAPGAEADLYYQVIPTDAAVVDLAPALVPSIEADPAKLWPQLFVNAGYTSETFKVPLSIEADFFGPPPQGQQPIAAVQVEFDDGSQLVLTADHLTDEAHLRIPLLPRLLGDPHAQKYKYRVTNEYGDPPQPGAQTGWMDGEGELSVAVVPAGA